MRRMVLLFLLVVLMIAVFTARADVQEPLRIRCEWPRPAGGPDVTLYHLQIVDMDGGLDTTFVVTAQPGEIQEYYFLEGDYLRRYRARVRGLNAAGVPGPWSTWSVVYAFEVDDPEP